MNTASVDLIYLDPPFNSKRDYAAPIGSEAAGAAFKDTWGLSDIDVEWLDLIEQKHPRLNRIIKAALTDSDMSYLIYMAARLIEMHRVLKPTGSIYLHCDPTMSHYLKLVMDAIFGRRNFRNEIVWSYKKVANSRAKKFLRAHDTILFYSGSGKYGYNPTYDSTLSPRKEELIRAGYNTKNMDGVRYIYVYDDKVLSLKEREGKIDRNDFDIVRHVDVTQGNRHTDVFSINFLNSQSKENVGYPTQKPLALLERIIRASSNEGDVVLDPFCGCATTCIAAEKLGRQWTGIDISPKAVDLVRLRAQKELSHVVLANATIFEAIARTDIPKRTDLGSIPRYNSKKNRTKLYGEQKGHCAGCGEHFQDRHLEVDHIIARSKGGTDHIDNLQLLCTACNRVKGGRGMEYLMNYLRA